ncbi:unnamed protein product [Tuber aestivum]|uniref:Uncharacterized protein n=1 Tax=Tuber aestivum TaxID=59557 RepID=A0A292Q4K9_9PEZI|nr:unnamed protein product [Tuber aestivum]
MTFSHHGSNRRAAFLALSLSGTEWGKSGRNIYLSLTCPREMMASARRPAPHEVDDLVDGTWLPRFGRPGKPPRGDEIKAGFGNLFDEGVVVEENGKRTTESIGYKEVLI